MSGLRNRQVMGNTSTPDPFSGRYAAHENRLWKAGHVWRRSLSRKEEQIGRKSIGRYGKRVNLAGVRKNPEQGF